MSKAKFDAVKELINEKHYDEARILLKTINHPTAREWEAKLDKIAPSSSASFMQDSPKSITKKTSSRVGYIILIAVAIIVLIAFLPNAPRSHQEAVAVSSATQTLIEIKETRTLSTTALASASIIDTPKPIDTLAPSATITDTPKPTNTLVPSATSTSTLIPTNIPTVAPIEFNSATSGQQPVLGPLTFLSGIYRITVKTNGFFIAKLETTSGTCDVGFGGMFNLSSGQGKGGASVLLKSTECSGLISISNVTDAWTMQFQQITSATPIVSRLKFDNTTDGTQPVIGPLALPSGIYRARVVTNGFFIAHMDEVSGTCDAGFMGLFNLSAGQANQGAETVVHSTDCLALISLSNVTDPWTLEFLPIS